VEGRKDIKIYARQCELDSAGSWNLCATKAGNSLPTWAPTTNAQRSAVFAVRAGRHNTWHKSQSSYLATQIQQLRLTRSLHDVHEMGPYTGSAVSVRPSVRMIRETLDGFWWNLVWTLCHWGFPQTRTFLLPTTRNTNMADKRTCEAGKTLASPNTGITWCMVTSCKNTELWYSTHLCKAKQPHDHFLTSTTWHHSPNWRRLYCYEFTLLWEHSNNTWPVLLEIEVKLDNRRYLSWTLFL
jgi:hypothetical protein